MYHQGAGRPGRHCSVLVRADGVVARTSPVAGIRRPENLLQNIADAFIAFPPDAS
jgi:hypothetical protein